MAVISAVLSVSALKNAAKKTNAETQGAAEITPRVSKCGRKFQLSITRAPGDGPWLLASLEIQRFSCNNFCLMVSTSLLPG